MGAGKGAKPWASTQMLDLLGCNPYHFQRPKCDPDPYCTYASLIYIKRRAWLTDTNGHLKWDRGWHVHYVLYIIYSSTCYQNGEDAEHHGISKGGLGPLTPLGGKTWRLKLKEKMHEVFIVYSSCFPAIYSNIMFPYVSIRIRIHQKILQYTIRFTWTTTTTFLHAQVLELRLVENFTEFIRIRRVSCWSFLEPILDMLGWWWGQRWNVSWFQRKIPICPS